MSIPATPSFKSSKEILVFGSILFAASIVRLWACFGDFWLDEIWSLSLAQGISSPIQVLTRIHHDNNNHLNTLFLYLLGKQSHWMVYRIPSLAAGIGSVALGWRIRRSRSLAEAILTSSLIASSYLLIHYASEARGYSMAVFFSLWAYMLAEEGMKSFEWKRVSLFAIASILGILSHLTFLYAYFALLIWMTIHWLRTSLDRRIVALRFVQYHGVPLLFFAFLYWIDIRHEATGGGIPSSWGDAYLRMLAYSVRGTTDPQWTLIPAAIESVVILGLASFLYQREKSDRWIFLGLAIFGIPALLQLIVGFETVYERHFLICSAFLLIAFSHFLAHLIRKGLWGKTACLLLIACTLAGNASSTADLLRYGRGDYLKALRFIVDHTKGETVTIGSDHDFRNKMVLLFYGQHLQGTKQVLYCDQGSWPELGPEWLIFHAQDHALNGPLHIQDERGNQYRFVQKFPYSRLSGWDWHLYRNMKSPSPSH